MINIHLSKRLGIEPSKCPTQSLEERSESFISQFLPIFLVDFKVQDDIFDKFGMRNKLNGTIDGIIIFICKYSN